MKVNVAQYVMNDLVNRFPIQSDSVVDQELLDLLIDRWQMRRYVVPASALKLNHRPCTPKYLM